MAANPQDYREDALKLAREEIQGRNIREHQQPTEVIPRSGQNQSPLPSPTMCCEHTTVPAVQVCRICGTGVCQTCDFVFPGNIHLCPRCVVKDDNDISPKRKQHLIWSYLLAAWCTFTFILSMSGVFASCVNSKEGRNIFGILFIFLVFLPSIVGIGLSIGSYDRRLSNPPSIWIAAIWNGLIFSLLVFLSIIGIIGHFM